jgi:hypothetical protein
MDDTRIVEWIEQHITQFEVIGHVGKDTYLMHYLDGHGVERSVEGTSLRDCVAGAVTKIETV